MNSMEAGNGRPSIVEDLTAFPYYCFVPEADVVNIYLYQSVGSRSLHFKF